MNILTQPWGSTQQTRGILTRLSYDLDKPVIQASSGGTYPVL